MNIELDPIELEMLTGLIGERLDDLELSGYARSTLEKIYYKLNEEDN